MLRNKTYQKYQKMYLFRAASGFSKLVDDFNMLLDGRLVKFSAIFLLLTPQGELIHHTLDY
jgi:hypothetical protein